MRAARYIDGGGGRREKKRKRREEEQATRAYFSEAKSSGARWRLMSVTGRLKMGTLKQRFPVGGWGSCSAETGDGGAVVLDSQCCGGGLS